MSRKFEIVRVPEWGKRDAGKHFLITEWYADDAERWAMSFILACNRGGGKVDVAAAAGHGMESIFTLGVAAFLRGNMRSEETIPILDKLLECVQMVRDPKARDVNTQRPVATPIITRDDIEEVGTRLWLRSEVIRVHAGFSPADALLTLISAIKARPSTSPNIETSLP